MHHPADLWPGGDSITDTIELGSITIGLPTLDAGDSGAPGATNIPKRCLITTNSNSVWVQIGQSGVSINQAEDGSDGVLIIKFYPYVFYTAGQTHIAFRGADAGLICITPLND